MRFSSFVDPSLFLWHPFSHADVLLSSMLRGCDCDHLPHAVHAYSVRFNTLYYVVVNSMLLAREGPGLAADHPRLIVF